MPMDSTQTGLLFLLGVALMIAFLVAEEVFERRRLRRTVRTRGRSSSAVVRRHVQWRDTMIPSSDDVLFRYVSQYNPKSNDDLKRFLRLYPMYRELIIDFTATWRALSVLEKILPPPEPDPVVDRQLLKQAKAQLRPARRRGASCA